jgi:hypothetical protein
MKNANRSIVPSGETISTTSLSCRHGPGDGDGQDRLVLVRDADGARAADRREGSARERSGQRGVQVHAERLGPSTESAASTPIWTSQTSNEPVMPKVERSKARQ